MIFLTRKNEGNKILKLNQLNLHFCENQRCFGIIFTKSLNIIFFYSEGIKRSAGNRGHKFRKVWDRDTTVSLE